MKELLKNELARTNRALRVLSECNQILVRAENEENFLQEVCKVIVNVGGYRLAWIGFAQKDADKTVYPVAQYGFEEGYLKSANITWGEDERGQGPTGQAIRNGKPFMCKNILKDPNFKPWRSQALKRGYSSSLALPLFDKDECLGALNIYSAEPDAFDSEELKLLEEFTNDLTFGIKSLRIQAKRIQAEEKLQQERDLLTRITETGPVGIIVFDRNSQITFANSLAKEILGLTKNPKNPNQYDVPDLVITDYNGNPSPKEDNPFWRVKREKKKIMGIRQAIQWPDGRQVLLSINASPLFGQEKKLEGVIATLTDVSEETKAEKELHNVRREWEDIFQGIGHPAMILNPDFTIQAVNRATLEISGLSSQELIGEKCFKIFHKGRDIQEFCPMERLMRSQKIETETMEIQALDRYFFVSCTPIFDEKGNLKKVIHISTDITERIKAEQALRENEAALNSIFRAAPVGIGLVSQRILKNVNDRICQMTGFSREELLGKSSRMLYPNQEEYEYVGQEKYRLIKENGTGTVETLWKRKDGIMINVLLSSTPIDQNNWDAGVTFTALDITERKQTEIQIRQRNRELTSVNLLAQRVISCLSVKEVSHEALKAVTNAVAPDAAILFLREKNTLIPLAVTPQKLDDSIDQHRIDDCLCGLAIKEGKPIFSDNIHHDPRCNLEECKRAGIQTFAALPLRSGKKLIGVLGVASTTQRNFSQQSPFLETLANEIAIGLQNALYHEEALQYAGVLEHRVTQRTIELHEKTKELEQANFQLRRADQLKSVFLASMSHELRTPLNSIIGFTGILLMEMTGKLNREQKKQLNLVKNSANHLLELINDILDISKIEAGKVEINPELFLMDNLIDEVKDTFSGPISEKGIELIIENPGGIKLFSDKRRVKQILFNLISNAVKFTDKGNITVSLRVISGKRVKISVGDTGIGIKKQAMDKLFYPFQQIDDTLTKHFEGTGLGLYLCKSLLILLGGEIGAKSKYGEGSIFSFKLPMKYKERK